MNRTARIRFGLFCLAWLILIAIGVRIRAGQPSRVAQIDSLGDVSLYFETDRTVVWAVGDCVTLRWDVQHIKAIYWSNGPTTGTAVQQWCPKTQADIPYFTIVLNDGRQYGIAPFDIETLRARLIIALLPLAIVAVWAFGTAFGTADWLRHRIDRLKMPAGLRSAFSANDRLSLPLIALYVGLNLIVLFNAIHQPPAIGYDAEDHYANVRILSQGRLPTKDESNEFFSPPVPYIAPAILTWVGAHSDACPAMSLNIPRSQALQGIGTTDPCSTIIRKFGQLQNVMVSLIVSFLLLRIGARLAPDRLIPRGAALFVIATLPVYYRTFAFLRGEPFIVLFMLLLIDLLLDLRHRPVRWIDPVLIGLYGGAVALSRQWGALIPVGVALWWIVLFMRDRPFASNLLRPGLIGGLIALVLAGSYYVAIARQTGTTLAFNRSAGVSDAGAKADPPGFFTRLDGDKVLTYPVDPGLYGEAIPAFYSEIWGDYWGYFYLSRSPIAALIPAEATRYLGMVNAVSLIPTLILLGSLVYGLWQIVRLLIDPLSDDQSPAVLFTLCILVSVIGFTWFLVHYPSDNADTAKATYMLQIFPLLGLLAGLAIDRLAVRLPRLVNMGAILLVAIAVFTLPMLFTRMG